MWRPDFLAIALCLLLSSSALADANVAVQFLGWSPDGAEYAIARHTTSYDEVGAAVTSSVVLLQSVDSSLHEESVPLPEGEDPFAFAKAEGFVVDPLTRRPLGDLGWSFIDDNGLDLFRFTVVVGSGLSWELATRSPKGKRISLASEPIDALYVDFEPDVFLAPDGEKALLVVGMRAPFRYTAVVRLVGLVEAPPPVVREEDLVPGWAALHPAPDAPDEPPPLAPGDVVIDWTQTEAVEPIVEPDPLLAKLAEAPEEAPSPAAAVDAPPLPAEPPPVAVPTEPPADDPLALPPVDPGPEPLAAVLHELAPVDESETVDTAPHEAPERTEEEPARVDEPPRPEKVARLDKPAPADERARVDESPPVDLEGTVRLVGFVRTQDVYKGRPIKGAQVTVTPGGTTTTNANGLYQIRVPVGTVTVAVQAKGYEPHSEVKELEPDIENWKTMVLVKPGEQRPPAVP